MSPAPPMHGRGAAGLGAWFAAAQLVTLLASPALTRLYTPDALGQWAIFAAVVFIGGSVAPLRFDQVVVVARTRRQAVEGAALALGCACCVGLVAGILAAALPAGIAGMPAAARWLLGPCIALLGAALVANGWLLRQARFHAVGMVRFGQVASASAFGVAFGLAALPGGLIAAQFAGMLATGGASAWLLAPVVSRPRLPPAHRLRALARRYRSFAVHGTPAVLVGTLALYLPLLAFGHQFGAAENGQFALARQCLIAVMGVLSAATNQAFMLACTRCVHERGRLGPLLRRQLGRQAVLSAAYLAAALLLAPPSFAWLFGAAWEPAGRYAAWLAAPLAIQLLVSPVSVLLVAVRRVGVNAAWQWGYVAALAVLVLVDFDRPARFLGTLVAIEAASYLVYLGIIARAARDHDRALAR